MKKSIIALCSILILMTSCLTTQSNTNSEPLSDPVLYMNTTETETYRDIAVIGLMSRDEKSGMFSYSVDRYEGSSAATMAMVFGEYVIDEDGTINFESEKFAKTGSIDENSITIEDLIYTKK